MSFINYVVEHLNYFYVKALEKEIGRELFLNKNELNKIVKAYKFGLNPEYHPLVQIANMLTNAGLHERSNEFYRRYLKKNKNKFAHSLYLQNLLLSSSATNQILHEAHRYWAERYEKKSLKPLWGAQKNRAVNKKIKIGYVCHFFSNSISQNVFLPFLKKHDRTKFEIYCYDDGETEDKYKVYADHWCDIRKLSDKKVAKLIADDGIDILQELNGICLINRFGALAYRPAPIQINWYNHTSTTGLSCVDYVMSDKVSILDSDLPYFVEDAYRHKDFIAAVHFDAEKFGPLVQMTPAAGNKFVTFGYFGASHKITQETIELWSQVLNLVPHSKLVLKCATLTHEKYRKIFLGHFLKHGITEAQIIFDDWSDQATTLQKYNNMDIMLDSSPVNGGSTMFEALLQGVPVVTLMGKRWAARSGPSVLTTLKRPELIAHSPNEYVDIAVRLANDIPRLNDYRKKLREEMLSSPLTNFDQFYQNFEEAYLYMWNRWCQDRVSHS